MSGNSLSALTQFGQSIWLDDIQRGMLRDGRMQNHIKDDAVTGVTSNPAIFEKAISGSNDYDEVIRSMAMAGNDPFSIYEAIVIEDVREAAELLLPVYHTSNGRDGFVSLEVSPHLAQDLSETVSRARVLWEMLDRPNVMIKVPATQAGVAAFEQLIAEGINVNVTLLFSVNRYRDVAEAFIRGLEARIRDDKPVTGIASVASFFLSRIDARLDPLLMKQAMQLPDKARPAEALLGQIAIGSARSAYNIFQELFSGDRWNRLQERGAQVQRLLWASTSTKNPEYSDVKYVEALIGPQTVNTLPLKTLEAYRDHGKPALRIEDDTEFTGTIAGALRDLGIDLEAEATILEQQGIEKFVTPFDRLIATIGKRSMELVG